MLTHDIGINSGIIWQLLFEKGALSIREIGELTGFKDSMIFLALGWLSKEKKIRFFEKDNTIYMELLNPFQETFY